MVVLFLLTPSMKILLKKFGLSIWDVAKKKGREIAKKERKQYRDLK